MKTYVWLIVGLTICLSPTVWSWGGVFSRYSPEKLANAGFGYHGYQCDAVAFDTYVLCGGKGAKMLHYSSANLTDDAYKNIINFDNTGLDNIYNKLTTLESTVNDLKITMIALNMPSLNLTQGSKLIALLSALLKIQPKTKLNVTNVTPSTAINTSTATSQIKNEEYAEDEPMIEEEPCYGKRCTANEHCCPGSVCVDVDGVIGNCLFAYGRKLGELCRRDADCESGLICDVSATSGASVCRAPMAIAKQYAEDCATSSDCDITRGLCCQLQRRHRQAPRKACSYFKDPLTCIGTVATDQIKHDVQHTSGEKRITTGYKRTYN